MRKALLVAGLCLLTASWVWAQAQPSAIINFDKDFNGTGPRGAIAGTPVGKPELVPGKFGQALKSTNGLGYLSYPSAGVLSRDEGTVEMWVRPLDWVPAEEKFHVFFEVAGQGALYLYKYFQGTNLLMLTCPEIAGPYSSSPSALKWQTGEWHHIVGTWSPQGVRSFVDGKPGPLAAGSLPTVLGREFHIGDLPWQFARETSSLVDEVRIYDRALSPAHIQAHYQGNYDFTVPLSAAGCFVSQKVDGPAGTVDVLVGTGGADVADSALTGRVALISPGAAVPAEAAPLVFKSGRADATLSLKGLPPGDYEMAAVVQAQGAEPFTVRKPLTIPDPKAWLGNQIGLEDKVLPPWTPLQVRGDTLSCWDRDYVFGNSPLPQQMTSGGHELLARPVALKLTAAGQPLNLAPSETSGQVSAARTRYQRTGKLTAQVGGRPVRLNVRTETEYDGFMVLDVSFDGPVPANLETMTLDIPMKSEAVLYYHRQGDAWQSPGGNLPHKEGVVDQVRARTFYWLGDNDRGLYWCCESDEMWPNGQAKDAIQAVRQGSEVILRLNLLTKGQKLPADWKFTCMLQGTPVKPLPHDWRKWRLAPGPNATVTLPWPNPSAASEKYFGYPEARDATAFAKSVTAAHEQGLKMMRYSCLSFFSAAAPEFAYYDKAWAMGPVDAGSSDVAAYGAGFAQVSPVGRGYADFIIWKNKQYVDQFGLDALYHDNTCLYSAGVLDAGCGYQRGGKVYPSCPIRGYRSLYRRLYAMMRALPRENFTMAHMSGSLCLPMLTYEDSYLDGEQFRGRVKESYLDEISLDQFRAEFMGRQWGVMPFFIPELGPEYREKVEPTRGMMALLMLHDVTPWAIWCNAAVIADAWKALDAFGYVDSDFLGYYEKVPPGVTDLKDVYVSAYKRADGKALLIVGNVGKEDQEGDLTLNAARLGLPLTKVSTWPDKQPLNVTGSQIHLQIPRLGYRMVLVEK